MMVKPALVGGALLGLAGGVLLLGSGEAPPPRLILTVTDAQHGSDAPSKIIATSLDNDPRLDVVLSAGLHSARSPDVSPDGAHVVFAGRRTATDAWSLWETTIDGGRLRQFVTGLEASDPLYLAPDRVAFSGRQDAHDTWALYAIDRNGEGLDRLTHHPGDDVMASLLRDGRIVFSHRRDGEAGPRRLFTMRPDGTGVALLYTASEGTTLVGRAVERDDRRVVVVERDAAGALRTLVVDAAGSSAIDTAAASRRRNLPARDGIRVMDVVSTERHTAAPVLLSVVDVDMEVGWIYGIDANVSDMPARVPHGRSGSLRISSQEDVWGEVEVQADGSFFVELPADTPFRLETFDSAGNLLRGPSGWLWVRPGEHRGCIGCHESRGMAPPNRVPLATDLPATRLTINGSGG